MPLRLSEAVDTVTPPGVAATDLAPLLLSVYTLLPTIVALTLLAELTFTDESPTSRVRRVSAALTVTLFHVLPSLSAVTEMFCCPALAADTLTLLPEMLRALNPLLSSST